MKITLEMNKEDFVEILESLQSKLDLNIEVQGLSQMITNKVELENKLSIPLYKMLSSRPYNILSRYNIRTFEDLVKIKNPKEMMNFVGMGKACYNEICDKVNELGLTFNTTLN